MSIRITGMNSGLDTDSMVKELVSAYDKKTDTYRGNQKKLQWKQDAWKELNTKVKNFVSKSVSSMRFSANYMKKTTTSSNSGVASVVTSDNAVNGKQTLKVTKLAQTGYLTGGELKLSDDTKVTGSTKLSALGYSGAENITLKMKDGRSQVIDLNGGDITINEFASRVKNAFTKNGVNASFDEATGRLFISSIESGADNDFDFEGNADALSALGLTIGTDENAGNDGTAKKIDGSNAEIILNGVKYENNTNTFSINGLTITANSLSDDEITLSTETDYNSIYDSIKDFLKEYNSLIKQLDTLYNAESADKYSMLTSEEKDAMSDDEVEDWEGKIKSALLRRDSNVATISSTMREAMLQTYEVNGKTYSLSSFGINTPEYLLAAENEKNMYHIDGDPDDSDTAGQTDKLKAAIATDPDAVAGFFQALTNGLYEKMNELSRSSDYRSYGNFYDDKQIQKEYDDWTTKISDYEDYVADMEEKYYKQFTRMEKAMGEMQSQQTYISQLMGG